VKEKIETYNHRISGNFVFGQRLEKGDTIQSSDVYDSTTGKWEEPPQGLVGTVLQATSTVWIRPTPGLGGIH
jgi:hypothetical protein